MTSPAPPALARQTFIEAVPALGGLAYLLFGALWIWLTDLFAESVFASTSQLSKFQTYKGVFFIAVSAVAVHMVLRMACKAMHRLPVAEQRADDSEAQYRAMLELSPDAIVLHEEGCILEANPAFRRTFGLDADEPLKGLFLAELVDPRDRAFIRERLECLASEAGSGSPTELSMRGRGGAEIVVEHASHALRRGGRLVVQSHFRDLSARNQARRELERLNQDLDRRIRERTSELQAANRALETFSHSVAHDLSSPVARVEGFAAALVDAAHGGDTQKACRYAQRIAANVAEMREMIDGLHRLSRAERAALQPELVDCDRMVRQVVAELDLPPNVTVQVDELGTAVADRATLRQVWANLIGNAVKYSARAGRPQVRVARRESGDGAGFEVSDNGVGFDAADADRLFVLFQRLPSSAGFDGSGVGLAIVKRIVERHGGSISASGRPGEGATFHFCLPRHAPACDADGFARR